jgi:signal transduction histidine kinase
MRTLRSRLILSHILPVLLIVPLVGIALVYLLETQVLLSGLSDELVRQAAFMANTAQTRPVIWTDPAEAQRFISGYSLDPHAGITLIDSCGNVVASSQAEGIGQADQQIDVSALQDALAGVQQVQVSYVQGIRARVVQVLVPVVDSDRQVVGVVRVAQQLSDVHQQVLRLRYLIAGVLGGELVLSVALGLTLALRLGRSLEQVTGAIYGVASGREWETLPEKGPEEIRLLLRAFNTLTDRLRLLEDARRHLLANLVHELGRPLGAIQSGIQALLAGADQDAAFRQELLEGMDSQVRRLRPLLDDLAELYGQVLGTLELKIEPVSLSDWLSRVAAPWHQAALDRGLHWSSAIPDSLPVLEIDPSRMAQALGNLLSNAIKYTPQGTISLATRVEQDGVAITVGDTGIGIDPSEQDRIFEPFYRGNVDERFPKGMGLGLSIARDLVTAHGGRLQLESTPGQGSRFTVWLPLDGARPQPRS